MVDGRFSTAIRLSIYLSKRDIPLSLLEQYDEHFISVITYMEVLGYQFKEPREEEYINELLGLFRTIYVDQKVADRVVEIRKNHRIKLPDAIIAATALNHDLVLLTRNTEDFKKLKLQNPIPG
jgi:predicted nucleic acid-binding protein